MKRKSLIALLIIMGMSAMTGCGKTTQSTKVENLTQDLDTSISTDYDEQNSDSVEKFSYQLFSENMEETNPVLSPVSAYLALTMAGVGADGNTRQEFNSLLGEDMLDVSHDLMNSLSENDKTDNGELSLSLANSAWLEEGFEADKEWLDTVKSLMDADVYRTALSTQDAKNAMNQWISEKTKGLIPTLLSEPLSEDARLALFNTIYFKGNWEQTFNKAENEKFKKEDGTQVKAKMMHIDYECFDYVENDVARGVFMNYKTITDASGHYAMLALLPKDDMSVRDMYENLTQDSDFIHTLAEQKDYKSVNLSFPKFEITYEKTLNDSLINMGLKDAFDEKSADFSLLSPSDDRLYISTILQKAVVNVDEEGTEAAAVTAVLFETTSLGPSEVPIEVYFDRPFLYMIVDMDQEIPLFIGIMDNPEEQ